jgi:hypothetical protein
VRTLVLRSALALILAIGLAGCDSPSEPTAVNGLTLTSAVSPATINAGSDGTVTATLRNVGNGSTTINLHSGCWSLIRVFKYPGNEPVTLSGGCIQVVVPVILAPGEEYRQEIHVGSGTVTQPGTVLPPGEYYTVASSEQSDLPDLRSRPVRFTVR